MIKRKSRNKLTRFVLLLLSVLVMACSGQEPLTVAEGAQNAEQLSGKTIRVVGRLIFGK